MSDGSDTPRAAGDTNDPDPHDTVVLKFYGAFVQHMDVWRQRMDVTTNWAAGTTAAMVTFCFGSVDSPHFVLLLANVFSVVYLIMESRRYQMYDLWRRRIFDLNRYVVAPVLLGRTATVSATNRAGLVKVGETLGSMTPQISLAQAAGYRIRRNYAFLFAVATIAWLLKLEVHPDESSGFGELVSRAAIGNIPGVAVFIGIGIAALLTIVLAARAPTERMENWEPLPPPFRRWLGT